MFRVLTAVLCAALSLTMPVLAPPAGAAAAPVHSVTVTGTGVAMYPAFVRGVERYGLTTTAATAGTVSVLASTGDPAGTVTVNGRTASGPVTLTGLTGGDEISVIIKDASGVAVHSLVYLPARFPTMTEVVPAAPAAAPGDLLVNLSRYTADDSPSFDAVLDNRGVPKYVNAFPAGVGSGDFKPAGPAGHYTVSRSPTQTPGRLGNQLVELDARFEEVRRFETQSPLVQTDGHDSVLRADGSRIMTAYEPNARTGLLDAVIQETDAEGRVVYTWNSAEHLDPATETTTTPGAADYAHINSIEVMADGDILASFRHLSAVLKIAWKDHDGFARGDIVWRLGGRHSDFTFVDDPYASGPCAQHSAGQLPNGHILVFDNGSVVLGADPAHCVDAADPTGPTVVRRQTRITEYAVDATAGTATLVWSYQVPGRFAYFAGSARRLPNGNTLIGWAAERRATATEVGASGDVLWELKNDDDYLSYRVVRAVVPDAIDPVVSVKLPVDGASYPQGQGVTPVVGCTDKGGSNLQSCTLSRQTLDTATPGSHTFTVTAADGAGNTTTMVRRYTVMAQPAPAYTRPDAIIRAGGGAWVGNNVNGGSDRQRITQVFPRDRAVREVVARLQNDGTRTDSLTVSGSRGSRQFRVRYLLGRADITSRVVAGTWRTANLAPGRFVDLRVRVTRLKPASARSTRTFAVLARSTVDRARADAVAVLARGRR